MSLIFDEIKKLIFLPFFITFSFIYFATNDESCLILYNFIYYIKNTK